jgi:hypothetical protein
MKELDNSVKIHQLKLEPADEKEFADMLRTGQEKLKGALITGLSEGSRYLVFQCLQHTFGLKREKWRALTQTYYEWYEYGVCKITLWPLQMTCIPQGSPW